MVIFLKYRFFMNSSDIQPSRELWQIMTLIANKFRFTKWLCGWDDYIILHAVLGNLDIIRELQLYFFCNSWRTEGSDEVRASLPSAGLTTSCYSCYLLLATAPTYLLLATAATAYLLLLTTFSLSNNRPSSGVSSITPPALTSYDPQLMPAPTHLVCFLPQM